MSAIEIRGVSKKFQMYARPIDRLKEMVTRKPCHQAFWALQDVSLEIEKGTTTGLVGINGSGKSTLLQIVAGTLTPTLGTVTAKGRLAALLELGAGFNPEFSGRENVHMNAALMGLDDDAIAGRFEAIARFAEIGDFIDRPVRTYSSGMYVRLAFATAIHLDPEILLVDEALAVGDIAFQHRCLRKIKSMQEEGVTILFVSHDLGAVKNLCTQAVLLSSGRVLDVGAPGAIVQRYTGLVMGEAEHKPEADAPAVGAFRHGDRQATLERVALLNAEGQAVDLFRSQEAVALEVTIEAHGDVQEPVVGFMIRNRLGVDVYGTNTDKLHTPIPPMQAGDRHVVRYDFPMSLIAGAYSVTVAVHGSDLVSHDWIDEALYFEVIDGHEAIGIANLDARASLKQPREVPHP